MRYFKHFNSESFEEACQILKKEGKSAAISGGTDLIGVLKEEFLEEAPDAVVNLKTIKGAVYIDADDDCFKIGALTKLVDIAESAVIQKRLSILSEAAVSVATPTIRNTATIGGNICQDVRCWYYRYPHVAGGRMVCARKGGKECLALHGRNQYHSVFGGMKVQGSSCTGNCPAGTDIPAYLKKLRNDDLEGAARILMKVNPIPALTARVCAHFCQETCNRKGYDEHVGIGSIERYVGDYILENSVKYYRAPERSSGKRIAIVGSGPAGLSAAYFLRKEGHAVVVYDRMEEAGGLLQYAIPAYRLPKHYVRRTVAALKDMGIDFVMNTEVGKDIEPAKLEEDFDKVFYDIGAWMRSVIGLEGEELTIFGLQFLVEVKEWMEGKLGKDVLVVGGGNVALDVAVTAKRLGAANVTLVCVEKEEEMPAEREDIERCKEEGIKILNPYGVKKVLCDGDQIKGMELVKCLSVFDEDKRFAPRYDEDDKEIVEANSILMAVGQQADLSFLDEKYQLELTAGGLIAVDKDTYMTSKKSVYAGGDVTSGPSTVIIAVAAGHGAAKAINKDLGSEEYLEDDILTEPPFLKFDETGIEKKEAYKLPVRPASERSLDLEDYTGLPWEQVKEEAARCCNCGCLAVNPSDISPVLVALDAIVRTTERDIRAIDFFTKTPLVDHVLNKGELVKEIEIPAWDDYKVSYKKIRFRKALDFAVVSLASAYKVEEGRIVDARIVLGGVAPVPYRMREVETFVKGKKLKEKVAIDAGKLACDNAICLKENSYKLQEIKICIKNSLLNCTTVRDDRSLRFVKG
jgi:NADPH-dependent glutamate synthase beta subunit-like oxidoreductase/CO/xanthine dehydrogenase FAD-binding subunit